MEVNLENPGMPEGTPAPVSIGRVLRTVYQDTGDGFRWVMREHLNGFSCSCLQWQPDENRWSNLTHVEKLFEDK
jgi:hypothetical protein